MDADSEALRYNTADRIKYAKERARKNRIEQGSYRGNKSRYQFAQGIGNPKPLYCDNCKQRVGKVTISDKGQLCPVCINKV